MFLPRTEKPCAKNYKKKKEKLFHELKDFFLFSYFFSGNFFLYKKEFHFLRDFLFYCIWKNKKKALCEEKNWKICLSINRGFVADGFISNKDSFLVKVRGKCGKALCDLCFFGKSLEFFLMEKFSDSYHDDNNYHIFQFLIQ